jgi:hypothetical protein
MKKRRLFVFAIGGTGSRVLRPLSILLAAGIPGMDSSHEVIPIIIDYDLANGDLKKAKDCLGNYEKIRKLAFNKNQDQTDNFFMTKITRLRDVSVPGGDGYEDNALKNKEFNVDFASEGTKETFAQSIGYDTLVGDLYITQQLLEALYDDSRDTEKFTELNLNLTVGFKGNPNIGSVVLSKLKETAEFKHFLKVFDKNTDRIFIISSIFGGTGSSGFPQIVNAIRLSGRDFSAIALIGACVVLPYFKVQDSGTSAINSDNFNSKTKAALSFYETSGLTKDKSIGETTVPKKINTVYYIGENTATQLPNVEGGTGQKNNAHIVELLAAMSVIDFMQKEKDDISEANEFGIKANNDGDSGLNISNFYDDESINTTLNYLTRLTYSLKFYYDVICGKRKKIKESDAFYAGLNLKEKLGKDFYKALDEFIVSYEKWLDELGDNKKKFIPYKFNSTEPLCEMLTHKPLRKKKGWKNIAASEPLTDDDFTKAVDDAYAIYRDSKDKGESDTFLSVLRKASSVILGKANNFKINN